MRRRYRVKSFLTRCEAIRKTFDLPAITTDIIAGFPGETKEDFEQTLQVAREAGFAKMHIFPFSPRKGTPAAAFPDQVPSHVLAARKSRLLELDRELSGRYLRQLVGRRLEVLVEQQDPRLPGHVSGTSCRKVTVGFPGSPSWRRELVEVEAVGVEGDRLLARPVKFSLPVVE
jgi:threonylcarbamoyladenosine tRNA methylthiotransferase MtaB